jgi:hypothetical protein
MIPTWQMEAYERLRTEVVRSAVKDLEKALRKSYRLGAVCDEQKQLERWFRSKWGQLLSGDNGELIIEMCHKRYKNSASKKGKQHITDDVQKRIYQEFINGVRYKAIIQRYGISPTALYDIVRRWEK